MKIISKKITLKYVAQIIKKREPQSHKGTFGHALIIAGSFGKIGAAVLAAKACLRSGIGLLTVYTPKCGYTVLQIAIPEAMVVCDENEIMIASTINYDKYNTIGIGCGIGTDPKTESAFKLIIQTYKKPMVIDADAINILTNNKSWLQYLPTESIFTPHEIEFERLVGKATTVESKTMLQMDFSKKYNVIVVLKGHSTKISCPNGNFYTNTTGNPGMAKAGNGDALTGIITALLAQNYSAEEASVLGVYLHGLAGDFAVKTTGEYALLATDLIDNIGKATSKIMQNKQ